MEKGVVRITETVEVEVPLDLAFAKWIDISSFPEFMDSVDDVREFDGVHSHWVTSMGGVVREFDATVTELRPGQRVAWTCTSGPILDGSVTFEPLADDRATVAVELRVDPQGLIEIVAERTGILHRMVVADLYRFKEALETAEQRRIETPEGTSSQVPITKTP